MNICIYGGTGLLGSHLAVALTERGHHVTLVARNPRAVPALAQLPRVRLEQGDIADEVRCAHLLPGHDVCISTVLDYGQGARLMLDKDVRPNVALGELAAECGVGQYLFTSSTAAVGDFRHSMDEEFLSLPIDYYCAGQRAIELFLLALSHKYPMRVNIIRPGYFFGLPAVPGGRVHDGTVVESIVAAAKANKPVEVMERMGTQYLDVADLARVFVAVMESDARGEIFFALGKPWIDNRRIAEAAIARCGSSSPIITIPNPDPGPPKLFTLTKIRERFGFEFDSWPMMEAWIDWLIANR